LTGLESTKVISEKINPVSLFQGGRSGGNDDWGNAGMGNSGFSAGGGFGGGAAANDEEEWD
jgi:hypothetical protein